jgi:hypothetical protein
MLAVVLGYEEINGGTLKAFIRQAGLSVAEFVRLL